MPILMTFESKNMTFKTHENTDYKRKVRYFQGKIKKAGDGNRTHVSSLEGWCSTIELHPRNIILIQLYNPETEQIPSQCLGPESNQ